MAADRTTVGLTEESRRIAVSIQERLKYKDLAHVRDMAVAHAIKANIEPTYVAGVQPIWGVAQISDDLLVVLRSLYPVHASEGVYTLYQNLTNLGLLALGNEKGFSLWTEISDLPGLTE
jgi:hypothetical protein